MPQTKHPSLKNVSNCFATVGQFPKEYISVLREYDAVLNTWRDIVIDLSTTDPGGRSESNIVFSSSADKLLIYGGVDRYAVKDDGFLLDYM